MLSRLSALCCCLAVNLVGCRNVPLEESETSPVGPSVLPPAVLAEGLAGPVKFDRHIKPMLEANCLPCHDGRELPAFLNLSTRALAFAPGPYGPRIVPGKPEASLLIRNLSMTHAPVKAMPPVGNRLTAEEKRLLEKWIAEGASWPDGPAGRLRRPAE